MHESAGFLTVEYEWLASSIKWLTGQPGVWLVSRMAA